MSPIYCIHMLFRILCIWRENFVLDWMFISGCLFYFDLLETVLFYMRIKFYVPLF
ncbi:hypothetical protein OIU77_021729 [Salix suchowensis]|uniref:Uncharacterized protein n=1 Tax=Salix suchowensis TaxID=1278906 RepID=A0ABQ9CE69_9ROSI|nr:hypothetical protein OIU78_000428 [Salix suchowensis]KAJ6396760.1 hypothetical protein OIU77_021729 [Salix suchowensis]